MPVAHFSLRFNLRKGPEERKVADRHWKTVINRTGYGRHTLGRMILAEGLTLVRTASNTAGQFRKVKVSDLLVIW